MKKGDYESEDFLVSALKGQDMFIIILAFTAPPDVQTKLIEAAAKAGVPWVIPCEFGSDNGNKDMSAAVPINSVKAGYREKIESLGKSSWIGIVNNPWFEYVSILAPWHVPHISTATNVRSLDKQSLKLGMFGINIKDHTATLFDGGNTRLNTTTMATVGLGVARLCELPISSSSSDTPSLSDYKNKFVYLSSFLTNQNEMLAAVQKATGTKASDWKIEHKTADAHIQDGKDRLAKGDFYGMVSMLYGTNLKEGAGGNYESVKGTANKALGLPTEDMDEVVKRTVQELGA